MIFMLRLHKLCSTFLQHNHDEKRCNEQYERMEIKIQENKMK